MGKNLFLNGNTKYTCTHTLICYFSSSFDDNSSSPPFSSPSFSPSPLPSSFLILIFPKHVFPDRGFFYVG